MSHQNEARVEVITDTTDLAACFDCQVNAFAIGTNDIVWQMLYPGWNTPAGRTKSIEHTVKRFNSTTRDKHGRPNSIFLKATLPDPADPANRVIAGTAIWEQYSMVDGYGNVPVTDPAKVVDLDALTDPEDREFAKAAVGGLFGRRLIWAKEHVNSDPPAIFALDLCAVDPKFWRRGIARKLVQWGLDEAKKRGDPECTTEASAMGRLVYSQLGFKPVGDVECGGMDEAKRKKMPENVFMRTRPSS